MRVVVMGFLCMPNVNVTIIPWLSIVMIECADDYSGIHSTDIVVNIRTMAPIGWRFLSLQFYKFLVMKLWEEVVLGQ